MKQFLALALLLVSCGGENTVKIRAHIEGEGQIANVYLIVGDRKEFWPQLKAGSDASLNWSGSQASEVTLLYESNGQRQSWTSPVLDPMRTSELVIRVQPSKANAVDSQIVERE